MLKEVKTEEERPTRPLSPTEPGDKETQPTIDVRAAEPQDNVHVKRADDGTPQPTETPTPAPPVSAPNSAAKPASARKSRKKKGAEYKPYEGLFTATIKMNEGPTVWEIEDHRENIIGGEKSWTEPATCLLCGSKIE